MLLHLHPAEQTETGGYEISWERMRRSTYPGIKTQRPFPKCALNIALLFQIRTLVTSWRRAPIEERGHRDGPVAYNVHELNLV